MSESDTMFNEWDWRCATVQLMLSTDPSYDNRTIASTLKMQIWMFQRSRAQLNASDGPLELVEWKDTARKTWTKEFIKKGPGNHWWNSPAGYSADCQRFRCLTHNCECMCEGGLEVLVLQVPDKPDLDWEDKEPQANQVRQAPLLPDLKPLDYFLWSYVENITNMTSHNTKASVIMAIRWVFAKLLLVLEEKACSQFRIRIEAVIEAEGSYIE